LKPQNSTPAAFYAFGERQAQIGKRPHVQIKHRELFCAIKPVCRSKQGEPCIVDEYFRLERSFGQRL
jgi:hypothetical protein